MFEPLSRKATQIAMGPWFIRDTRRPFRPGCSYEVIKKQALGGKIKPNTIVRGPTTRQFWSVARNTPGLAHLLGVCHDCGNKVRPSDSSCSKCDAKFNEPMDRNELGLQYKTHADAEAAQKQLDQQVAAMTGQAAAPAAKTAKAGSPAASQPAEKPSKPVEPGSNLLDEVLSTGVSLGSESYAKQPPSAAGATTSAALTPNLTANSGEEDELTQPQTVSTPFDDHADSQSKRWNNLTVLLVISNAVVLILVVILLMSAGKKSGVIPTDASRDRDARNAMVEINEDDSGDPESGSLFEEGAAPAVNNEVAAILESARRLEDRGELTEAQHALQEYADAIPRKDHPAELTVALERIAEKIKRKEAGTFFSE